MRESGYARLVVTRLSVVQVASLSFNLTTVLDQSGASVNEVGVTIATPTSADKKGGSIAPLTPVCDACDQWNVSSRSCVLITSVGRDD